MYCTGILGNLTWPGSLLAHLLVPQILQASTVNGRDILMADRLVGWSAVDGMCMFVCLMCDVVGRK